MKYFLKFFQNNNIIIIYIMNTLNTDYKQKYLKYKKKYLDLKGRGILSASHELINWFTPMKF